ncbi:hypothetical protein BEH94_08610 [Candidatus Altiarchaeales archaeon WOR_SM1_SCG]|nr:hypothetical protein BEH94_08610 [Candidatus Altiarchaeales archaeon WOR_SM1_SCG]
MSDYEPIIKKPGDLIKSEDWNTTQEEIKKLYEYINRMASAITLVNLESSGGIPYDLTEKIPGDDLDYGSRVVGHITKQWYKPWDETRQETKICKFGIVDYADIIYYWAGAGNGDKKTLKISLEDEEGNITSIEDLFIHERSRLRPKGEDNPYIEFLSSPNDYKWYKYKVANPNPDNMLRYITFYNTDRECTPRIGNVIQYVTKIKSIGKF